MSLSRRERREQRRKLLKEERLQKLSAAEPSGHSEEQHEKRFFLIHIYDRYYKELLIIPILILVISLVLIGVKIATTGDFINKGVSLKGGVVITVPAGENIIPAEIETLLRSQFPKDDIGVRSSTELGVQKAIIITTDNVESEAGILQAISSKIPDAKTIASTETTGSSLGGSFFIQTAGAMLIAFIFMGVVVFISFRTPIPSSIVILCAFADILETIVIVNLLGLKVSTAGIAAFLMLIGYSVDTDILLTTRVLKSKEGSVFDRTMSAFKTGMLMTLTTLTAVVVSLLLTQSETIREIMLIMLIGLILDILNTWLQNTALLRWYLEHKKGKIKNAIEIEPEIIEVDE
jgi:preprotein translocase subunit SecF